MTASKDDVREVSSTLSSWQLLRSELRMVRARVAIAPPTRATYRLGGSNSLSLSSSLWFGYTSHFLKWRK
eukprot:3357122-Amphidinium_carterae.1